MSSIYLEQTLPHLHHIEPNLRVDTSHLVPLYHQVMYRLIHTYDAIDPLLEKLQPEYGLNNAAYTFFAEKWLKKHIRHLFSYDLSFDMVNNHGSPTIQNFQDNNVSLSCMNILNLAFPDNTFDVSTYIELAGTSRSTDYDFVIKSLHEVHRVLKPGGSLFINFKNVRGDKFLTEHKQYAKVASEIQSGFPRFRGVAISRDRLIQDTQGCFEEVTTLGQGFITPDELPFVYTVENHGIQWDPQAIKAKPIEQINFKEEHPLYWTMQFAKI